MKKASDWDGLHFPLSLQNPQRRSFPFTRPVAAAPAPRRDDFVAVYGVAKDMYKRIQLGYNEVAEAIQDGSIDAGFIAGTYPIPPL